MGRKKLTMEMISNKKTLNRTYNNRKVGILKKASELSTLCDIDVGVIIFSSKEDEAPQVWPKEPEKLNNVIRRYLETGIDERRKRATNVASFVKQENQERPKFEPKKEKKSSNWDERIEEFSCEQLVNLVNYLDSKIGAVDEKIQMMKQKQSTVVQSCGGAEQGNNMMMMMNLPAFGYESYDHQRAAQEFILMKNSMLMMNGGGLNYGCNPTNVNMGEYTGLLGMQGNENYGNFNLAGGDMSGNLMNDVPMYNPNPMMAWNPNHDLAQLQMFQAHNQVNGDQLYY